MQNKIVIAIVAGILALSLGGGAIWYGKYQAAKKAEEEKQKLQTRIIAPAELPPSALAPTVPIIFLTASPDFIKYDGTDKAVSLKVAIGRNPTSCAYSWDKNLSSVNSKEYALTIPGSAQTHQTYTITCESEGGSVSNSATVTISAAEPPAIDFFADKNQIEYKKSATLTWSSQGATNCDLKDKSNKILSQDLSGSKTLSSLTKSNAYIITCSGPGGQTSKFISITVNAPPSTTSIATTTPITPTAKIPTLSLSASAESITYNSPVALSWSASNVSYCNASSTPYGAWSDTLSSSGSEEIKNLTESTTFTLNCEGNNGNISKSVSVAVSAAPIPVISLSADPISVSYNSPATLSWSATNATSCTASGGWSGSKAISGSEQTGKLTSNKTYTLTCLGISEASVSKSVSITAGTAPTPTISFSAEPAEVSYNGSSKLTWSATNATSCTASGGWSGPKVTSGSEEIKNLTSSKTFTFTCTGIGGNISKSASVTVGTAPALTISFSAEPVSVVYNNSSTLSWSATNATSCTASGGWSGSKAISGSEQTGNLTSDKTYILTCAGFSGSASKSVSVTLSSTGWKSYYMYGRSYNENTADYTAIGGQQYLEVTCKKGRLIDIGGVCERGSTICASGAESTSYCKIGCTRYKGGNNDSIYKFECRYPY